MIDISLTGFCLAALEKYLQSCKTKSEQKAWVQLRLDWYIHFSMHVVYPKLLVYYLVSFRYLIIDGVHSL